MRIKLKGSEKIECGDCKIDNLCDKHQDPRTYLIQISGDIDGGEGDYVTAVEEFFIIGGSNEPYRHAKITSTGYHSNRNWALSDQNIKEDLIEDRELAWTGFFEGKIHWRIMSEIVDKLK